MSIETNRFKRKTSYIPANRSRRSAIYSMSKSGKRSSYRVNNARPMTREPSQANSNITEPIYRAEQPQVVGRLLIKMKIITAVILAIVLISGVSYWQFSSSKHKDRKASGPLNSSANSTILKLGSIGSTSPSKSGSTSSTTSPPPPQLAFSPAIPVGKPQLADLGINAYDKANGTYSFNDLFLAEPLLVTEQLLPGEYINNPEGLVDRVAKSLKASSIISTNSGLAYMATDGSTDKQTIVFSKKGLLIFVQSTYEHDSSNWATYLDSLQ